MNTHTDSSDQTKTFPKSFANATGVAAIAALLVFASASVSSAMRASDSNTAPAVVSPAKTAPAAHDLPLTEGPCFKVPLNWSYALDGPIPTCPR